MKEEESVFLSDRKNNRISHCNFDKIIVKYHQQDVILSHTRSKGCHS